MTTTADSFKPEWNLEMERKCAAHLKERLMMQAGLLAYFAGAFGDVQTPALISIAKRMLDLQAELQAYLTATTA